MNKSISVVIAAYNCSAWIRQTMDSALNQTYPISELIVVDDGSTDDTQRVVKGTGDERVKYLRLEKGSGSPAKPRNVGFQNSSGEYVSFLDHDDIWYSGRVEAVMKVFASDPSLDIVCHDEIIISDGKSKGVVKYGPFEQDLFLKMMLNGNRVSTSASTIKSEAVRDLEGFREGKKFFLVEDFDLWLRLAKAGKKYFFLHKILGEYTLHAGNWTKNIDYNYSQEFQYYTAQINEFPEYLMPWKSKILGRLDFVYGRAYQKNGFFNKAKEKYLSSFRNGYISFKLLFLFPALLLKRKI